MTVSRFSILSFLALVLTAIALIPAGAHVFEMSAKMKLGRDAYFVVQGLYRGWAYFGIALLAPSWPLWRTPPYPATGATGSSRSSPRS